MSSASDHSPHQRLSAQQHFEAVSHTWIMQLAGINCIKAVISDRRRRLFPEGAPGLYMPLDNEAFWIDLPPELILPGELNLVHEPSIFDSPLYVPWLDAIAQLVFAHHYDALMVYLREQGVSEQCLEAPTNTTQMGQEIYRCILTQTQRTVIPVGQCYAFKATRVYPRSIYTSPRRNAGVLFRTGWADDVLKTVFADATDGKRYFMNQLCRLPVDLSLCQPRSEPVFESLGFRLTHTDGVCALTWEGLDTGRTHAWCMGTTFFVSPGMDLSLSDVEAIANGSKFHVHCAVEDCCWLRSQAHGTTSMQALSVKAYHSALAKHYSSKLQPPPSKTIHLPHGGMSMTVSTGGVPPEQEYHQSLAQYCKQFITQTA